MKCLKLRIFWNKALLGQTNLSSVLESSHIRDCLHLHESCQHVLVWRHALYQDSTAMEQPCAKAPAWMCHWEGTPDHTTWLLQVPGAIQDAKELPVPFSSLYGWWDTRQGRFQHTINHQKMERMVAAETQICHSLPGNFSSRDDITRNQCMEEALTPKNGRYKGSVEVLSSSHLINT